MLDPLRYSCVVLYEKLVMEMVSGGFPSTSESPWDLVGREMASENREKEDSAFLVYSSSGVSFGRYSFALKDQESLKS